MIPIFLCPCLPDIPALLLFKDRQECTLSAWQVCTLKESWGWTRESQIEIKKTLRTLLPEQNISQLLFNTEHSQIREKQGDRVHRQKIQIQSSSNHTVKSRSRRRAVCTGRRGYMWGRGGHRCWESCQLEVGWGYLNRGQELIWMEKHRFHGPRHR